MAGKKVILVGISGASNSGKTSLTSKLVETLPGVIRKTFTQDWYFYDPGDKHHVKVPGLEAENYDVITSLDMERMVNDIKEFKDKCEKDSKTSVILVEGFLLYVYKPLRDLFDRKYFLTISEDVCRQRRSTREYIPADIPGYFEKAVWPAYEQYVKDVQSQKDIIYLDGDIDQDKVFQTVCADIQSLYTNLNGIKDRTL